MAKILLIAPNGGHSGACYSVLAPLGLLYVGTTLDQANHSVRIVDAEIGNLSIASVLSIAKEFMPDVVGVSLNCAQLRGGYLLIQALKSSFPGIRLVVGGPHPSALKEEIFKECPEIDIVVVGEGERTMLELVETLAEHAAPDRVNGIIYREGNTVVSTAPRDYIQDLEEIPRPNYDLIEETSNYLGTYPVGACPQVHLMAARGCPFHCTFCNDSVWGNKVRFRSPQSVVDEIEYLLERFKAREVFFQDDTLNLTKSYFHDLCDEIIARGLNEKLMFKAPVRANEFCLDTPLLEKAKEAGFWMLFYGVETGNPEMMKSINKNLKLEEVERAMELTSNAGIKTLASFMIGNLGENRQTAEDTYEFFNKLDPDFAGLSTAIPFPGTEFHREAKKRGLLRIVGFKNFKFGKAVTDTGFLTAEEVDRLGDRYSRRMIEYKRSQSRKCRLLSKVGESLDLEVAQWHAKNDYYQSRDGQVNYYPEHIPARFLDYEQNFEPTYNLFMEGWYKPDKIQGEYECWSKGKSQVILRYNTGLTTVHVKCYVGHPDVDRNPVTISVDVDGATRKAFEVSENKWYELEIPLSAAVSKDRLIISLSADRTFNPKALNISQDPRDLGLLVKRVWLS